MFESLFILTFPIIFKFLILCMFYNTRSMIHYYTNVLNKLKIPIWDACPFTIGCSVNCREFGVLSCEHER